MAAKEIVIVEDEPMTARLIDYRLKAQGYHVTHIEDGIDALKHLKESPPDLLILDVMLPGMSGFEILEHLQDDESVDLENLKVIMLTTKSRAEDISRGFRLGAVEYLSKPFKMDELLIRLNRLVEQ